MLIKFTSGRARNPQFKVVFFSPGFCGTSGQIDEGECCTQPRAHAGVPENKTVHEPGTRSRRVSGSLE